MLPSSPLTIFATPKRFEGHIGIIQRNAIQSWTHLSPKPDIVLFGTEAGVAEVAAEFGLRHVPNVKCNQWGTPLVSDLFEQAETLSQTPVLAYVNSDIILFDDLPRALQQVAHSTPKFLMVGRRTDLDVQEPITFDAEWSERLRNQASSKGKLQIARSIDYFAFSRGLYPQMPPLAIGRFWWDNWLLWKARSLDATVVDASRSVLVVHQNHDYSHTTYGPSKEEMMASDECILNAKLTCQSFSDYDDGFFWRYAYTIDDASHKLTPSGIQPNSRRLWKQVKRYSSRPVATARLLKRAVFGESKHKGNVARSHAK